MKNEEEISNAEEISSEEEKTTEREENTIESLRFDLWFVNKQLECRIDNLDLSKLTDRYTKQYLSGSINAFKYVLERLEAIEKDYTNDLMMGKKEAYEEIMKFITHQVSTNKFHHEP